MRRQSLRGDKELIAPSSLSFTTRTCCGFSLGFVSPSSSADSGSVVSSPGLSSLPLLRASTPHSLFLDLLFPPAELAE